VGTSDHAPVVATFATSSETDPVDLSRATSATSSTDEAAPDHSNDVSRSCP